jgi:hypothetical protein
MHKPFYHKYLIEAKHGLIVGETMQNGILVPLTPSFGVLYKTVQDAETDLLRLRPRLIFKKRRAALGRARRVYGNGIPLTYVEAQ